jgi:hypothetical protein
MIRLISKVFSVAILAGSMIILSGCPGDSSATDPMKVQLGKLSKTWTMVTPNGAVYDGSYDRSAYFTGFKLTISGTYDKNNPDGPYSYSVAGSMQEPSPWPASGTWTFSGVDKGSDSGTLIRDDGVGITYFIDSSGKLVVTFDCVSCNYPGAKVASVNDTWQFTFQ